MPSTKRKRAGSIPLIYRPRAGAELPEAGPVARVLRLSDEQWLDASDPTGATWSPEPGEPWPMAALKAVRDTFRIVLPTPREGWGDEEDVLPLIYAADAANPLEDDPLDWQPVRNYQPGTYEGEVRVAVQVGR